MSLFTVQIIQKYREAVRDTLRTCNCSPTWAFTGNLGLPLLIGQCNWVSFAWTHDSSKKKIGQEIGKYYAHVKFGTEMPLKTRH